MSQLFDKFTDKYVDIPNNQFRFLPPMREYKDVIALGADNEHTFQLPYEFKEIKKIEITYVQGTDIRLVKTFDMSKFVPDLYFNDWSETDDVSTEDQDESINPNAGIKIYNYTEGGAKLFELDRTSIEDQLQLLGMENHTDLPVYCVLYYDVTSYDTLRFNDYNKEVYVQMKLWVDIVDDAEETEKVEFSKKFKIKLESNISDTSTKPNEDMGMNLAYEEVE